MKFLKGNGRRRLLCGLLALLLLLSAGAMTLTSPASAASSKELQQELDKLRAQQSELRKQSSELESEIKENQKQTQTVIEQKYDIDRQITLSSEQIDNLNAQIQQYNQLIAQKQEQAEASEAEEEALQQQYKARLRAMEETGSISYWSILFQANSFSDLLDRVDMIHEIAKSDQIMMKKLSEATAAVEQLRSELEQQKSELQTAQGELSAQEAVLEQQRAEADELLVKIAEESEKMTAEYQGYLDQEAALSAQIAKSQQEYYQALSREEAERLAEQNKNNNYVPDKNGTSGFLYPLPYQVAITDSYGYRTHPVSGKRGTWHNGRRSGRRLRHVDLRLKERNGHDGCEFFHLGQLRCHQSRRRLLDAVCAYAGPDRFRRRLRQAGADDRLCRLDRPFDRPAPALYHLL